MAARRRRQEESFDEYRSNLKEEAVVERIKLAGRWVWRSFMPNPEYKKEVERVSRGLTYNQAKPLVDAIPWYKRVIKLAPFRREAPKPKRPGAARRERIRQERANEVPNTTNTR